jgi:hypothetical protein
MAIYDFFLSRNGAASTPENYVGHEGRLFYDSATGEIRISDGVTLGGLPIPIAIATDIAAGGIKPGALVSVTSGGVLNVNYSGSFNAGGAGINTLSLNQATETVLGGIKLGPGITTNAEGQLLIDSEGLEFSFGDFSGTTGTYSDSTAYALLQSINEDEDIAIASNGTGSVNIVGEFNVFATNTDVTDALENYEPIFRVLADGKVRMLVPAADTLTGAFEIVGNTSGFFHPTNQTGVILHTTGNTDSVNRVYHDAINNYPIIVGRRYNGTIGALENVKSGETIFRIAGQASTGTDFETFGPAKINWIATEDQGPSNQGGKITIDVTANGTTAFGNVITALEITPEGVVSTVGFEGDLTGNADTVTNGVYTTDTGTVTNTMLAGSIANDKLANSTISGVALGGTLFALSPGNYLTGGDYDGSGIVSHSVDATTTATASKVVARDASGNFAAGTITANLTGTASTATNLAAATGILAGTFSLAVNVGKNSLTTLTQTITGLTTSHKVIITPATAMVDNDSFFGAAWASATNTLSIQFSNQGGGVNTSFNISYFAFV